MSVFTPTKQDDKEAKVHHSQYIRTQNAPDEGAKPAEPVKPTEAEAK